MAVLNAGDPNNTAEGDGYVFLVDRKKDLIKTSGYRVSPTEIEHVLCEHPAVREAFGPR